MFISLQDLESREFRFEVEVPAGDIDFDLKVKQCSPLQSKGRAQLVNASIGEVRVRGDLRVDMEGLCDRCVEVAQCAIESHFDLVYLPGSEAPDRGADEIDEGGTEVGYYEGNGLELNDVLREVVLLALPMRLTCQEDCKGICPVCGQNRNQVECGCRPHSSDDRWNKLRMMRAETGPSN